MMDRGGVISSETKVFPKFFSLLGWEFGNANANAPDLLSRPAAVDTAQACPAGVRHPFLHASSSPIQHLTSIGMPLSIPPTVLLPVPSPATIPFPKISPDARSLRSYSPFHIPSPHPADTKGPPKPRVQGCLFWGSRVWGYVRVPRGREGGTGVERGQTGGGSARDGGTCCGLYRGFLRGQVGAVWCLTGSTRRKMLLCDVTSLLHVLSRQPTTTDQRRNATRESISRKNQIAGLEWDLSWWVCLHRKRT